jgi:hypothetical protein
MPVGLPLESSANANSAASVLSSAPLYIEIAYTPKGDGSWDVSWSLTQAPIPGTATTQLAGGSLRMLPTDKLAKLLYLVRGAALNALQNMTMSQILPAGSGNLSAGQSHYHAFPFDWIAALPSLPSQLGQ